MSLLTLLTVVLLIETVVLVVYIFDVKRLQRERVEFIASLTALVENIDYDAIVAEELDKVSLTLVKPVDQ